MGSSSWGHVRFNAATDPNLNVKWVGAETDIAVIRQLFVDDLAAIYGVDQDIYRVMRGRENEDHTRGVPQGVP